MGFKRMLNLTLLRKRIQSSFFIARECHRSFYSCESKPFQQLWKPCDLQLTHSHRPLTLATYLQSCQFSTCGAFLSPSISLQKKTMIPGQQRLYFINPQRTEALHVPQYLHLQQVRKKSKKKSVQSDSDSDSDEDDGLAADDFDAPAKFKVMKIYTASMRSDAIISNALDVARNRLEEVFYGPGLLLNGSKMLKKSIKMEEGDYVDLVVDRMEDQLKVKRVKVIKIYSGRTNTDKLNVKVRVWKAPFLVKNPDNERRSS